MKWGTSRVSLLLPLRQRPCSVRLGRCGAVDEAEAPGDPFAAVEAEVKGDAREHHRPSVTITAEGVPRPQKKPEAHEEDPCGGATHPIKERVLGPAHLEAWGGGPDVKDRRLVPLYPLWGPRFPGVIHILMWVEGGGGAQDGAHGEGRVAG